MTPTNIYIRSLNVTRVRHPLRFAVAHKRHNKQMATGWLLGSPWSLNDRDNTLNNILIETSTSNFLKWNYAEDEQTQTRLKEMIKTLNIGPAYYNPSLHQLPVVEQDSTDIDDDHSEVFEDHYIGEEIDETQLAEKEVIGEVEESGGEAEG